MTDILSNDEAKIAFLREQDAIGEIIPAIRYSPHTRGQLQFHQATHPIRALFPGTGFGKTTAGAAEADAWARHTNRWQPTPPWPVRMIWFAKLGDTYEMLREQLESEIFGSLPTWSSSQKRYTWPDGSILQVALADDSTSWEKWQGINPDLVLCDEQPQPQLWREMLARKRGRKNTRYCVMATATKGISWMYPLIYKPWKEFHEAKGLSTSQALVQQLHDRIWVWDKGGIDDNPGASEEQRQWARSIPWASEKERKVRLYGGFEDWVGDAVFDPDALERMRQSAAAMDATHPSRSGRIIAV